MKKFIALAIAIVMMAALAVPAFAAGTFTLADPAVAGDCAAAEDAAAGEVEVEVRYHLSETYTLTIPAEVVFATVATPADVDNAMSVDATLTVADTYLGYGRKLTVTATGDWTLADTAYDAQATIAYTMTSAGTSEVLSASNTEAAVLEVNAGTTNATAAETTLTFATAANAVSYAGCYTDTITFNSAVDAQ